MDTFENWGDYFWPGRIDDCRRNLLDIHDPAELHTRERYLTATRAIEWRTHKNSAALTYDLEHVKAIHRHLFQDVYAWAGQLRVTELVRPANDPDQPANEFVKPADIERLARVAFGQLGDPATLASLTRAEQIDHLARTYAAVNVLHPFIDGNGRTNRLFLLDVAQAGGLSLDLTKMRHQNEVMAEAFSQGYQPIAEALAPCVVTGSPQPFPTPARFRRPASAPDRPATTGQRQNERSRD